MLFPKIKKISKLEINKLPLISYTGEIKLCDNNEQAEIYAAKILKEKIVGFDTETKPTFKKGEYYLPSLLQLASSDTVYLFQIKKCSLSPTLIKILSNPSIIKAGVAINRDIQELKKIRSFNEKGFIELADIARNAGVQNLGLRSLTAIFLDHKISKKEQVSNWSKNELTQSQKKYAATDAWLSRELYLIFQKKGIIST